MTEFVARAAAFSRDEELGTEYLVLAEHEDGSGQRIELQRALTITDDDRRLGMDTYCLVNEAGATYYGGVDGWVLEDGKLELRLDQEAAQVLDVEGGYRIRLADTRKMAAVVRDGLRTILGSG